MYSEQLIAAVSPWSSPNAHQREFRQLICRQLPCQERLEITSTNGGCYYDTPWHFMIKVGISRVTDKYEWRLVTTTVFVIINIHKN